MKLPDNANREQMTARFSGVREGARCFGCRNEKEPYADMTCFRGTDTADRVSCSGLSLGRNSLKKAQWAMRRTRQETQGDDQRVIEGKLPGRLRRQAD
jgi:hypothetical protein